MSLTITSALRWWAVEQPDAVALSVDDHKATFAELEDWSGRIGGELVRLGARPGDRVGVLAANSLEYCALVLGALKVGAIVVPLNFRLTLTELRIIIEETSPALLFFDHERESVAQQAADLLGLNATPLGDVSSWRSSPVPALKFTPTRDTPAGIIFTSGSTSRPKGVVYLHEKIVIYACEFGLTEPSCARGARTLNCAPFSASSGFLLLFELLVLGCTQFIESKFEPDRAVNIMVNEKINTFQAAPIFFERISRTERFAAADLSNLRFTQISGARIDPALLKRWRDKGVVLRPGYGLTEAGGGWAARATAAMDPSKCGRGGLFTEFSIRDQNGAVTQPGEQGEIHVSGPSLMVEYWNNSDATDAILKDGWLSTGDLGVMDEDGNLTFVDRLKDIIISGGLNISAAEIEYAVSQVAGVEEVAVIAAKDASFGETPMAIIYGSGPITPSDVVAHCNIHLSNYKVPRFVAIETEPLPRLASGKISKSALRVKYQDAADRLPKLR
jgi:fatty-acyl-CoA synthase